MSLHYIPSEKNFQAQQKACRTLGIGFFLFGSVLKNSKGRYDNPESAKRATIAERVLRARNSEIERVMFEYETKLARIEAGKARLNPKIERTCSVCGRDYTGAYEACPVCLDVYHNKFRKGYVDHFDSCDTLRIIDA